MKNYLLALSAGAAILNAALDPCIAAPIGNSNYGREYASAAVYLGRWSCGLWARDQERDVDISMWSVSAKSRQMMAYVGYDIYQWFAMYGAIGNQDADIGGAGYEDNSAWAIGMHFNLLDHDIMVPILIEDRLRVNVEFRYTDTTATYLDSAYAWEELYAKATIGIVNDTDGNKLFLPESIVLFAGPIYSAYRGDVKEKDTTGFTAGLEVFVNEKISLSAAIESVGDNNGADVGLSIRF